MAKDLSDIACAIAPAVTQRTLENLRRTLEDLYVKSTAQGSTPEDRAVFSPQLIAQAHEAAMRDNAETIATWALAIQAAIIHAEKKTQTLQTLQVQLDSQRDKLQFLTAQLTAIADNASYTAAERERRQTSHAEEIHRTKKRILSLARQVRDLLETQTFPGRASQTGPGEVFPADRDLDGPVSTLS
jgi:hypothetical protein